jgi:hypothetical protein
MITAGVPLSQGHDGTGVLPVKVANDQRAPSWRLQGNQAATVTHPQASRHHNLEPRITTLVQGFAQRDTFATATLQAHEQSNHASTLPHLGRFAIELHL